MHCILLNTRPLSLPFYILSPVKIILVILSNIQNTHSKANQYIYIRGGTVHVFVSNRHGTGISVRCMRPYDEYRQFTPIQKDCLITCLITASRSTANANGDTEAGALMFGSLYFILIKYQLAVKLAMLELMCASVCASECVCVCARVCVCDTITSTVSLYQQNQL